MAIRETRRLELGIYNDTQIALIATGLSESYTYEGRTIVWTIFEGTLSGSYEEMLEHGYLQQSDVIDVEPGTTVLDYFFGDLEPQTMYTLTGLISGIVGENGETYEVLYIGWQSTAESGGGELGTKPQINKFTAEQTAIGERKIYCDYDVSSLITGEHVVVLEVCKDDVEIAYYKQSNVTDGELSRTRTISKDKDGNELEFGTYEVTLRAQNRGTKWASRTLIVKLVNFPECTLNVVFADKAYSYDNGRVTGTIHNYPFITAENWNQFCEDINTCRTNSQLSMSSYSFTTVVSDETKMTANILNEVYYAINEIYETYGNNMGVTMPSNFEKAQQGYETSKVYFNGLNAAIQTIRDVLYTVSS